MIIIVKVLIFGVVVMAFVLLIVPTNVSAFIPENIPDTPNQIDWVIFFVTSKDECNSRNDGALDFYASLTDQYLSKFKTSHKSWAVECISKDIMAEVVNFTTKTFDLVIIIPDSLMSIQDRHTTASKGHYSNWNVHTIVSQAYTLSIEDRDTAWTLSHELAHFIVAWNGFSGDIIENSVHSIQEKYNQCYSTDTTLTHCNSIWETIKTPSGSYFPVMSSTYLSQVVESMKPVTTSQNPTTSNENKVNSNSINKLILDYGNKKNDLKSEISNKINKYKRLSFESPLGNAKHGYVLNQLRSINFESSDYSVDIHSKNWMNGLHSVGENGVREEIKKLYGLSNKIKQLDSEITKAYNLESEYVSKKLESQKKVKKDADYWNPSSSKSTSSTTNILKPSLFAIDKDGKKSKQITVKPNEKFTVEGYIYKNNVPQKSTTYNINDNIGNSKSGMTNSKGFFKHVFTSEHTSHQNFGSNSNKGSTIITKVCISSTCEGVKIFVRGNDYKSNTPTIEKSSITKQETQSEDSEWKRKALSEKSNTLVKISDLKSGIDRARNSISGVSYDNKEAQSLIDEAWNEHYYAKQTLTQIKKMQEQAQKQYEKKAFKTAYYDYKEIQTDSKPIEKNLKMISKLLEDAKKIGGTSNSCFMWWC